jgi:hypothetical protein
MCSRAHAGIQQLLDLADDLAIRAVMGGMGHGVAVALHHRGAGGIVLHDRAQQCRW